MVEEGLRKACNCRTLSMAQVVGQTKEGMTSEPERLPFKALTGLQDCGGCEHRRNRTFKCNGKNNNHICRSAATDAAMSWTLEVESANDSGLPRHPCRVIASGIKIGLERLTLHLARRKQERNILQKLRPSRCTRVASRLRSIRMPRPVTHVHVRARNNAASITKSFMETSGTHRSRTCKRTGPCKC